MRFPLIWTTQVERHAQKPLAIPILRNMGHHPVRQRTMAANPKPPRSKEKAGKAALLIPNSTVPFTPALLALYKDPILTLKRPSPKNPTPENPEMRKQALRLRNRQRCTKREAVVPNLTQLLLRASGGCSSYCSHRLGRFTCRVQLRARIWFLI